MKMKNRQKTRIKIAAIVLILLVIIAAVCILLLNKNIGLLAKGNSKTYSVAATDTIDDSPIYGKTIIFLGSSVTKGMDAYGESFVDFLEKRDGVNALKYAVSGTCLTDDGDKNSYISRMKTIDKTISTDAFVCQLSTNDATKNKTIGEVSNSRNIDDFDTATVAGAIEYIICYAEKTWNCPVIFYTNTKYDSEEYKKMVDILLEIQDKWEIGVIDLWNNDAMYDITDKEYSLYMVNEIHPSRAGYKEWWLPVIENYLYDYLK